MKNLSLILNAVLFLAVGVLFYLQLSKPSASPAAATAVSANSGRIGYINADTVLKYYDFLIAEQKKFDAKGQKVEQDLKARAVALQSEIDSYKNNYGSMTIGQAKAVEEDLARKNQNFEMNREKVTQELMVEQENLNRQLYDRITAYLKTYGASKGLDYVLKYNTQSDVLFASDSMDVTQDVIKGLNEEYRRESGKLKEPEKKKK